MKHKVQAIPNQSLRRERELRGWSQQEVAERIDAPSSYYISRWERGVISPSPLYRERLCALFGKNAQELELLDEEYDIPDFQISGYGDHEAQGGRQGIAGGGSYAGKTSGEPVYWSVPYWRNPIFTGRSAVLEHLHKALYPTEAVALTQALALYGLGGIGKTQTAVEYAYRYADIYRAVFWIGGETVESIQASLLQIADLLGLPERETEEQAQLIAAVRRWLIAHQGWLVIIDNVEDLDLLQTILPPVRRGALLLTMRHEAPATLALSLELPPMSEEEGIALLLARARPLNVSDDESAGTPALPTLPPDAGTVDQATKLVRLLEGLPLALDQAGAYLQETGCQLADYVQRYALQRKEVLARRGTHGGNHPASVTTTVMLAIEQVAREQPVARDLLRLCACLQAEAIPDELFLHGAPRLGAAPGSLAADPYRFDQMLAALRSASLLTRYPETKTISLHRLVQAVLLDAMSDEERAYWNGIAIEALDEIFPAVEHAAWKRCERLLPHILVCLRRGEQAVMGREQMEISAEWAGISPVPTISKSGQGRTTVLPGEGVAPAIPAESGQGRAIAPAIPVRALASLAGKTAHYLHARGKYGQAEELYQQALRAWERALGAEHPEVARTLNGLAITCWIQGKYGEAEPLYRRALQIREQALGAEHPEVARTLNGLAVLYDSWGKYGEAEPLFRRAVQIWERKLGPDDPHVALALNGLAMLYESQSRYGEAEPLERRAVQIWEQALGAEHPDMALPLESLASLCVDLGKYGEAEELYQRAQQIRERVLEPEHPDMALFFNGLAGLYAVQERDDEAEQLYLQAWQIWERALGTGHIEVALPLSGLSTLYRKQRSYVQAESLGARALWIREQRLGTEHPAVAHSLQQMGLLYVEQGKYEQAELALQRALSIYEAKLGADLPHTAACLYGLGYLFAQLKDHEQAIGFYHRALHIFVRALGEAHPRTKQVIDKYNESLQALGNASIEA